MDVPYSKRGINQKVLSVLAPVLILVGVLGIAIPAGYEVTSGALWYNVFHILFGVIAIIIVITGKQVPALVFNGVFGVIDLYQAIASSMNWFPAKLFLYMPLDDVLHWVIGLGLIALVIYEVHKEGFFKTVYTP
jgi:hypothetical protein